MHTAGKIFVKTYLKAIRGKPFFPICGISQCVILIQQKEKV